MRDFKDREIVYLIFRPPAGSYKLIKLNKVIGHVLMVKYDYENNKFLEIDPRSSNLHIKTYNINLIEFYKNKGYKILCVDYFVSKKFFRNRVLFHMNCVSLIKYILNYKCWAFTPRQLFNHLTSCKINRKRSVIYSISIIQG